MLEIKYVIPFITLFIGGLIGNWLALSRDKRKEFNEAASLLFETLEIQKSVALSGSFPATANETDKTTFIQIKRKITFCKRKGFEKAIDKYVQAKNECGHRNNHGEYIFDKPEILLAAIEDIQKYLPHK